MARLLWILVMPQLIYPTDELSPDPPPSWPGHFCIVASLFGFGSFVGIREIGPSPLTVTMILVAGILVISAGTVLLVQLVFGCERPFWQRMLMLCGWVGIGLVPVMIPAKNAPGMELRDLNWVPAFVLCSQLALWPLRYLGRWRLIRSPGGTVPLENWSVRDFVIGTALVGIALASARVDSDGAGRTSGAMPVFDNVILAIFLATVMPCFLLPAAWYFLRMATWKGIGFAIAFHLFALGIGSGSVSMISGPTAEKFILTGIVTMIVGAYVLLGVNLGLWVLRLEGFRLIFWKETRWPGEANTADTREQTRTHPDSGDPSAQAP